VAADPTRRAVLTAAVALPLVLAGCKGTMALGSPPQPGADVDQLHAALASEALLIASYRAVLRQRRDGGSGAGSGPATGAILATLLAQHEDHQRQLHDRLVPGAPQAAGSGPLPSPHLPTLPAGNGPALDYLSKAEQAASDRLLDRVSLVPPALAQLFASIAAAEATHVPVLRAAGAA
jgi:hypothetical protein